MKTALFVLAFILAVSSAAVCAARADFIISFWCGPIPSEPADTRYAEVAEAGFTVTMPPCAAVTVKDNIAILEACEKHNLKAIIGDGRIMAKDPGDPEFEKNLDAVIADYSKYPALYGYHIMDEPGPGWFAKLAAINVYLLKKDPAHLPYINIYPNYVDPAGIGGASYTQYVEQFLSTVKPKLLSYDHYALFAGYERDNYFENLEIIRSAAQKHNVPWMNIVLATPHFAYRNPSEADLRWQVYTTLAYGGSGIAYFTYWTPVGDVFRNGILDSKGDRTEHYEMVKRLNAEIKALAPILLKLKSTGVYHTGKLPKGTKGLPDGTIVKSAYGDSVVIGLFKGPKDSDWVFITNSSPRKPAEATVVFASPSIRASELSSRTGKLEQLDEESYFGADTIKLKLRPGEGRLFRISGADGRR